MWNSDVKEDVANLTKKAEWSWKEFGLNKYA